MKKQGLIILVWCLLLTMVSYAQSVNRDPFNKEISFTTENDAYLLKKADAYYTNGFFVKETRAIERRGMKLIRSFEFGQMIYTPLKEAYTSVKDIDRPYCGYLFAKLDQTSFPEVGSVLQYGASLGIVGPASFGEDVQNGYHKLLGYSRFAGWNTQVRDAAGIDLNLLYSRTALAYSDWLKFMPVGEAKLGSTFTNTSLGAYTCLGEFSENANSALWNARVDSKQGEEKTELFFYWYPQVILQAYNATVEGGLFNKGDSAVLGKTKRWMFQQAWGLCFAKGRWTTRLAIVYQSREAEAQKNPQRYGSIQLGYRMH